MRSAQRAVRPYSYSFESLIESARTAIDHLGNPEPVLGYVQTMSISLKEIIDSYDPEAPLEEASTIPASWYVNDDVYEAEQQTVFSNSWQVVGRIDQVRGPGEFITREVAGEPLLIVRAKTRRFAGFTTCAGITQRRFLQRKKEGQGSFGARIMAGHIRSRAT